MTFATIRIAFLLLLAATALNLPAGQAQEPATTQAIPDAAADPNNPGAPDPTDANPAANSTDNAIPALVTPTVLSASESKEDLLEFEGEMDMADVIALFRQQQAELNAQRKLLESQSRQIATLTQELETIRSAPDPVSKVEAEQQLAAQQQQLATQAQQIATLTNELDVLQKPDPTQGQLVVAAADGDKAPTAPEESVGPPITDKQEQAIETGNQVAEAQADDPTRDLLNDFTGAWRMPGTDAALRIGGFVKTTIVYNNDPLQINDRFIVGSIPVGIDETTGDEAQSSVTADQSRLNFDLRTPTDYGIMRAFIEGDFAGSGGDERFRLRHAFGQWNKFVTGKTWTTFMDPDASPEEIDFEGLNGRINVRQAQARYMPTFGEEYELQIALEDPNPEIQNGSGVTRTPDLVLAGRFYSYRRLHTKLALMAREIRGQSQSFGDVEKEFAWGASLSGSFATPQLDERDKLLFQLNFGDGIGRYVNDLSSIGNFDGVFEPGTNNLELFEVTAGYISWQHWWGINELRSNFTFGAVEVDNPGFIDDDAYKRTIRFSTNVIWSPIPRIDVGGEYLWGKRENEGGEDGTATQFQVMAKYRF